MIKFILFLSSFILYFFKKLSGANITISGEIPKDGSALFLANHFTRFETIVVPYILFSQYKRIARSLADDAVFVGWIGAYMRLAGSVSNKNKIRDMIIINDLVSGKADWIIYPEGYMIKNKLISCKYDEYYFHTDTQMEAVHTGAAVLALKSEMLRKESKEQESLQIIPLTITYYPIRPGINRLLLWIDRYLNVRGTRFFEELEVEINLLMNSNMNLHFSQPIPVARYIESYIKKHDDDLDINILIDTQRKILTYDVMTKVYGNLQINFDHILILSLVTMPTVQVCPSYLKTLIYKNVRELRANKDLNLHPELQHELFRLILDAEYPPFMSAIKLAQIQKILYKNSEGDYLFDKNLLEQQYDFNKVRVKNTLQVILNEIKWNEGIVKLAYENAKYSEKELREDNFLYLQRTEWKLYEDEFLLYHKNLPSKNDVGAPIVLIDAKNSIGLVFSHGYMAAPAEAKHLAAYLFDKGINVYVPRLRGHGTAPEALQYITEIEWEVDFERAFTAMRQVSEKVFIGGFSTGGLLALLLAAKYPVDGVMVINSALKLNNLKVSYVVPSLHAFNEMISYLHAKGIGEWVENNSENPDINYAKHPLKSIAQMEKVMTKTDKILENITAPILVLQGDNDSVVNPKSAQLIYDRVQSKWKKLVLVPRNNHTIIIGTGEESIFESINRFILDSLHNAK
jgi:esterase/lipase/1-acyl-sn-glycerol-3-phosphate acyltransferase